MFLVRSRAWQLSNGAFRSFPMVAGKFCRPISKAAMTFVFVMSIAMIVSASAVCASILGCRAESAETKQHRRIFQKVLWLAAGSGAGYVAGPGGSAVVGVVRYRDDLAAGPRRFFKGAFRVAAPVAVSIVAGPAGAVGYA